MLRRAGSVLCCYTAHAAIEVFAPMRANQSKSVPYHLTAVEVVTLRFRGSFQGSCSLFVFLFLFLFFRFFHIMYFFSLCEGVENSRLAQNTLASFYLFFYYYFFFFFVTENVSTRQTL